jgi:hypothetical protein
MKNVARFLVGRRCLCLLFVFCPIFIVAYSNVFAITYDDFAVMRTAQQRELIAQNFSVWLDAARNMQYTCDRVLTIYDRNRVQKNPSPHKMIHRQWLLENTYRVATKTLDPTDNHKIVQDYQSSFSKQKGEMRGISSDPYGGVTETKVFGRIDTVQDLAVMENPFLAWLSDQFVTSETRTIKFDDFYLYPFLLRRRDSWEIIPLPDERLIKVQVSFDDPFPFGSDRATRQVGRKTLILDPQKGFLPVQIDTFWEELPKLPGSLYRTDKYIVEESKKFDSFWVPIVFRYEILESSSLEGLDQINVYSSTVSNVEFGTVKQSDVEIVFPEGTEVVDAINGISYKTDARGEPVESTIEPLYGLDPSQVNLPPQQKEKYTIINYTLMAVGITMIVFALARMYRQRQGCK